MKESCESVGYPCNIRYKSAHIVRMRGIWPCGSGIPARLILHAPTTTSTTPEHRERYLWPAYNDVEKNWKIEKRLLPRMRIAFKYDVLSELSL